MLNKNLPIICMLDFCQNHNSRTRICWSILYAKTATICMITVATDATCDVSLDLCLGVFLILFWKDSALEVLCMLANFVVWMLHMHIYAQRRWKLQYAIFLVVGFKSDAFMWGSIKDAWRVHTPLLIKVRSPSKVRYCLSWHNCCHRYCLVSPLVLLYPFCYDVRHHLHQADSCLRKWLTLRLWHRHVNYHESATVASRIRKLDTIRIRELQLSAGPEFFYEFCLFFIGSVKKVDIRKCPAGSHFHGRISTRVKLLRNNMTSTTHKPYRSSARCCFFLSWHGSRDGTEFPNRVVLWYW